MLDIKITAAPSKKEKPSDNVLGFGRYFTDHMFIMDYSVGEGWHDARIVPYGPIALDPSAMVFHYAQELFEGLKAYRCADGHIQLFRPDKNIERMNNTCRRMCVPEIPMEDALQAIKTLVEYEKDWVPSIHYRHRRTARSSSLKDLQVYHYPFSRRLLLCRRT